jgi:hypothetical protein
MHDVFGSGGIGSPLLTLAQDGGEELASRLSLFTPGERASVPTE